MNKNLGYKAMIRDRLPKTIDLALRWTQSKSKWVDHVYSHFIGIFKSKEDRNTTTRIILGISSRGRKFDFNKTIDWESLTVEEKDEWVRVEGWVTWFQKNMVYIDSILNWPGNSEETMRKEISALPSISAITDDWKNDLITFIIKNK